MFSFGRGLFASCAILGAFWGKSDFFVLKLKYYFTIWALSSFAVAGVARRAVFTGKIGVDGYFLQKKTSWGRGETCLAAPLCASSIPMGLREKAFRQQGEKAPFPALSRKMGGGHEGLFFLSRQLPRHVKKSSFLDLSESVENKPRKKDCLSVFLRQRAFCVLRHSGGVLGEIDFFLC